MNTTNQIQNRSYTFTRSQIQRGDVRAFLTQLDPAKLTNDQLAALFGRLHLAFDGIADCEIPTRGELRILLRRLHAIWPWSGFFLDLEQPLGPALGANTKPLLALALCVADRWIDAAQAHRVIRPQLQRFLFTAHDTIDRLGKRAGQKASVIQARHEAATRQFQALLGKNGQ